MENFRGESSQKTWLLVIARNYCYSKLRRAEKANTRIDEEGNSITYEHDFDTELTLKDAIGMLTPEQNEIFFLRVHSNYSYTEIAEITSQSVENVSTKLFRIRQKLKKILKDEK